MHPTDTLALSGLTIAKAAAAGEGSGRGPQVTSKGPTFADLVADVARFQVVASGDGWVQIASLPKHDRMITGMSAASTTYETGFSTLAAALEAMSAEPDPQSVTRTDAGASTSARMGEGFGNAYADHYGARGSRPMVFRADGSIAWID